MQSNNTEADNGEFVRNVTTDRVALDEEIRKLPVLPFRSKRPRERRAICLLGS